MILELLIFILTTIVIYFWYSYKRVEKFYEERNVKFLPGWPFFGNSLRSTLQKGHMFTDFDRVYKSFPNERYVGFIEGLKPTLLIRDPELIKLIGVKDFEHFMDHREFFSEHTEPLFGSSLLSMKEHKNEEVDVEDFVRRYTNDVIASASFGLEVNSLKDRDNEFFKIGQSVLSFDFRQLVILTLDESLPSVSKMLGLKVFPEKTYTFFNDTIENTVKYRKANNVSRPDMLQLLIETPFEWTPLQLCAQAFVFFAAGFETSASLITMSIHELCVNPDVQKKLYDEVKSFNDKNVEVSSDGLSSLKYLDCIINESLRKWSPSVAIDRKCTKTYVLPPPSEGGKPVTVNPGDIVFNSSNSIHLDPEHWPDPMKYDPDRWSDENKHKIKPFTFQPFGLGPRICIGSRFAILEAKVLLYYLVLNFKILKSEKTSDPIELVDFSFNMKAKGGTWVKFVERKLA